MKMKNIEKQIEHHWKPMEEYEPEMDAELFIDMLENPHEQDIDSLRKMKPNQFYLVRGCELSLGIKGVDLMNTTIFHKYIEFLRKNGFDICNDSNSQYGYRMPLPKKEETKRKLIIFRRHLKWVKE